MPLMILMLLRSNSLVGGPADIEVCRHRRLLYMGMSVEPWCRPQTHELKEPGIGLRGSWFLFLPVEVHRDRSGSALGDRSGSDIGGDVDGMTRASEGQRGGTM